MCGRFTMATHAEALEERFHAHLSTEVAAPTYNVMRHPPRLS
jgi:putative SOS response-associated peptidase YedK